MAPCKKSTWRSAKPIHFLWDRWFSDTISRHGPTYVMSSCISTITDIRLEITLLNYQGSVLIVFTLITRSINFKTILYYTIFVNYIADGIQIFGAYEGA